MSLFNLILAEVAYNEFFVKALACLGAGLCMGLGAIGPALAEGFAAAKACEGTARQPEAIKEIRSVMLIGQAVSETTGLYSLLVAILLIFVA